MAHCIKRAGACTVVVALTATFLTLLTPTPAAAVSPDLTISQVYGGGGNSGATWTHDFIEIYNRGTETVSVEGWSVQYGSATGVTWAITPLVGEIPAGEHYLVQEAQGAGGTTPLPTPDATGTILMAATAGKVALVTTTTALSCTIPNCDTAPGVRDFVGYGGANDSEASPTPALTNTTAALRLADGATDTDNNSTDFVTGAPNPRNCGEPCVPPPPPCDPPPSFQIAEIQGSGASTPIAGDCVLVEGVVTGDFNNDATGLGGFYMQDDTPDSDPATSDGIFVASATAVALGDRVQVDGTAAESFGETRVNAAAVSIIGTGAIAPDPYDLPRPMGTTFEPVEGVLLTFPETLTLTEHFQLGRFGEVTVSSDGRLLQPTDQVGPGGPAQALLEEALRRKLLIDDSSNVQNPFVVPYVSPGSTLRLGAQTTGITGVLGFGFSNYRLQPTAPISWADANPRPAAPDPVGGDLQVASFNTLNYFTTLTTENPDARGANSPEEFARQQVKEVEAITGLDADVLGLMEVENNGAEAIQSLVDALNAATAPGTYAFVVEPAINPPNEFGGEFGTDAIKVSFVYKPAVVTPVGAPQTSTDPIFDRPPLIQEFQPVAGGESFTAVVNHFKSKNCATGSPPEDEDQGDGQSCFNGRRVAQATTLLAVLDGLDTTNTLIIGDLNAYTEEDPVHTIEAAGYVGLSEQFIADDDRYSFVFDGFAGELDHGMAAPDLVDNVTGATIWHINADEPLILDYNLDFGRDPALYQPNEYRASDHDPLLVGLSLSTVPGAPEVSTLAGWGAVTVSWTEPESDSAITGYTVRALVDGTEVDSVSVGPDVTTYTFGQLENGVVHTFEVVAENGAGAGPAGTSTAMPREPRRFKLLAARVECPTFAARNANKIPVSVSWTTTQGESGVAVVPARSTVLLDADATAGTTLSLFAGDGELQDVKTSHC